MQPKIVFLGTGGDGIVVGKQLRASGGIILQVGENQFHIDPGPGSLIMANKCDINLRSNTAVLVSNNNIINSNDVNAVIEAMSYEGIDIHGVLVGNKSLFENRESSFLTEKYKKLLERDIFLEPGRRVGINDVEIRATSTVNKDPTAIGFKFLTSEFTLTYTSDTDYDPTLTHDYKDSDIMILNVPHPEAQTKERGLCREDAIKILKEVKPKLAIIQHFGIKMLKSEPLNEAREIQKSTRVQTIAATDGLVINPISYAGNLRKKRH